MNEYWLTRFLILRLLGLVYVAAFVSLAGQVLPLIGSQGLTPVERYVSGRIATEGSRDAAFAIDPSLFFWLDPSDAVLQGLAWIGVALSIVVLAGYANVILLAVLWALYMSFVHVGQVWYGYGWEIQLLETGFLSIFLCPLLDPRPFPRLPPPAALFWLYRWLIFRIMLGSGLIKLRGDPCWRDLTCLDFHYETQPIPNPLSWYLHFAPSWFNNAGVAFNHVTELVAPWFAFVPAPSRYVAGAVMLAFQLMLIASGNLSWLNYLTIIPILACFDDRALRRVLPARLFERAERARLEAKGSAGQRIATPVLTALIVALSIPVVVNLLSPRQRMNDSFSSLDLVNTYGAFGSVGKERHEIVFEGTRDEVVTPQSEWKPYEFLCKPGDPMRRPCVFAPLQLRLDWQIWFAAMSTPERQPWAVHFSWKLLHGDPGALSLLANDPVPDDPPRHIRARLFRDEVAPPGDPSGAWWKRTLVDDWLYPMSREDPRLREFLETFGWLP